MKHQASQRAKSNKEKPIRSIPNSWSSFHIFSTWVLEMMRYVSAAKRGLETPALDIVDDGPLLVDMAGILKRNN